ncbi:Uracil-DNA glycosylase, family 4 [Candidatus Rhodobacter oscarellae]|uniref:Type-4 uracil-DNA glycosylase n=1 Tax=Candidatus Rhodobacter oscarellae TaxID=1675527 RepID=A0A0J9E693_9RHOB|nr:uracil-DNA glycosylase [Candidatus Rhodobacter lobularis]KMW58176.1 Uracil-DNA glycosylase, family 4 [Candidatus Rhodobacter lobularis]
MDSELSYHDALAALAWQVELGADEAILDAPLNRYDAPKQAPRPAAPAPAMDAPGTPAGAQGAAPSGGPDAVESATHAAQVDTLAALHQALAAFEHCELKRGARNTVFSDGYPAARVMIIGEAPGRDEDIQGKPFVGRAGQLLDRMFNCISMDRAKEDPAQALYITNILPWRPPQNRDPKPDEIAMMLPFMRRHIELVDPQLIVLMGNISCQAMLGRRGITRLRGAWQDVLGRPALPMFHPAYLLRNTHAKREAWADLLALQARLRDLNKA